MHKLNIGYKLVHVTELEGGIRLFASVGTLNWSIYKQMQFISDHVKQVLAFHIKQKEYANY